MKMKPRSTTLNPRALLYKRFIGLEKSSNMQTVYKTYDEIFWSFDNNTLTFYKVENSLIPSTSKIIEVSPIQALKYQNNYFYYTTAKKWVVKDNNTQFFEAKIKWNNTARYQANNYYYVGSFVYTHSGTISETTTQYLKGNTMPLSSMSIKTYEDSLEFKKDDLCVIGNRLYSIEEVEHEHKQMPKDFYIHYLTLNSIL